MSRLRLQLAALLTLTLCAWAAWGLAVVPSTATAQATVTVEVRGGEARVTLTPSSGGRAHSCQTRGGRCEIAGLAAGQYVVTAAPAAGGEGPIPRPVMVGGRATTVRVSLR